MKQSLQNVAFLARLPTLSVAIMLWAPMALAQGQDAGASPAQIVEMPADSDVSEAEKALPAAPQEVAASLHAQALLAEHDGSIELALDLLRQAHKHDPEDEDIAFDLARLTLEESPADSAGRPRVPDADVRGFLAMELTTSDARVLRAYLLELRGDRQGAKAELAAALAAEPQSTDALALNAALSESADERPLPAWLSVRAWSAAQFDSNIAVLPDDNPSRIGGPRMLLGAELFLSPLASKTTRLDVLVNGQIGVHLSGKEANIPNSLAQYDFGSLFVLANLTTLLEPIELRAQVYGVQVFTDIFRSAETHQFLQEGGGRLGLLLANSTIKPGVYVEGGYRDFVAGNPEGDALLDRDAPRVSSGLQVEMRQGRLSLLGYAGYQQEFADGTDFQLRGVDSGFFARYRVLETTTLGLDGRYQWRDHFMHSTGRTDHRIEPRVRMTHHFSDWLAVNVSYLFVRNISNEFFDYSRHVGQLGLEGAW